MQDVRPCHVVQHQSQQVFALWSVRRVSRTPCDRRVRQESHQHGGSQNIPLGCAVDEVRVLVPDVEAGVLLEQRPVLLQCAAVRGIEDCANPSYVLMLIGSTLQDATSTKLASNQSSRCRPCSDCAKRIERQRHGILHAKLVDDINSKVPPHHAKQSLVSGVPVTASRDAAGCMTLRTARSVT